MSSDADARAPTLPAMASDASASQPLRGAVGQMLAGKYRLVGEIGRGGMGEVWRAVRFGWDDSEVAVKLLATTLADTPDIRERFKREARSAAKITSEHVVKIYDHGVDDATGMPFIVMEQLAGESLGRRLRHHTILNPGEVLRMVKHLGRALSSARAARVVHRDLKPDNVFRVDNGDEPIFKVLDFGLAKTFDTRSQSARWRPHSGAMTIPGDAIGTPAYMSPEQLCGMEADHVGDLWSLAVIACECLVGTKAFLPLWTLNLMLGGERPIPSQLGVTLPGFDAWFAKATHPHIEERFQTAEELVEALCGPSRRESRPLDSERVGPVQGGTLGPITRPPPPERGRSWRRGPFALVLATTVVAGLGVNAYLLLPRLASRSNSAASQPLQPNVASTAPAPSPPAPPAAVHGPAPVVSIVHADDASTVGAPSQPASAAEAAPPATVVPSATVPVSTPSPARARPKPQRRPRAPVKRPTAPIEKHAPEFKEEL